MKRCLGSIRAKAALDPTASKCHLLPQQKRGGIRTLGGRGYGEGGGERKEIRDAGQIGGQDAHGKDGRVAGGHER